MSNESINSAANLIPTFVVKVLVAGHVVSYVVARLPTSKQREPRSQLELKTILHLSEAAGGNVSNLIPVVHVLCGGWEEGL